MIQIDWQQIIAYLLLGGSGIGGTIWAAIAGWKKFRSGKPATTTERSADEFAPPGAVEWVNDICKGMSGASADTILSSLQNGHSRAVAMRVRISELEAKP